MICCPQQVSNLYTQVIALITPYAIRNAGWKFYLLFIIMISGGLVFTFFFFPEVCLSFQLAAPAILSIIVATTLSLRIYNLDQWKDPRRD